MKLDLTPAKPSYGTPTFGEDNNAPLDPRLQKRIRQPMMIGGAVIAVLVVGLGLWASLTPLASGITAQGQVAVESMRKTLRHPSGGTVRQILVREGQHVRAGQPLLVFDEVQAQAAYDVYRNQADSLLSLTARLQAEASDGPQVVIPPELLARQADPRVASMLTEQQLAFTARRQLYDSQISVLEQRLDQVQNQISGQQAQVAANEEQLRLTKDEMSGYQTLYEKGYAPRTLILRYERSVADLAGKKGSLAADIARLKQVQGETRMQMVAMRDQRQSQAAEQLREAQAKLADTIPRLTAAEQELKATTVRSPVDGYIFNLTQFTPGGATAAGEVLMDVVPANAPMVITAVIKPQDIEEVHVGMEARVRIDGLNQRWHSPMPAKVSVVSADRIDNPRTGASFYRADLRIDPKDARVLHELKGQTLTPGMPASVLIVTGKRTIMGFLISPITDTIHDAFREQ